MKKLLKKMGIFLSVVIGILGLLIFLSTVPSFTSVMEMLTNSVSYHDMGKAETLGLWGRAKGQGETTKLILGDSVANQLYEYRGNEEYYVMTGNMAMTLAWQYIFAKDYLDSHPEATDVYLCTTPDALVRGFETKLTYSYLLIPLVETNNMDALEEKQTRILQKMYGSVFVHPQMVSFIGKSGLNTKLYLNIVDKFYELFPQKKAAVEKTDNPDLELAETYIMKIYEMCKEKNVTLHLIPNPKKDTPENREHMERIEEQYKHSLLYEINPNYFEQIVYYPEECFKDDLHFKDELMENGGKFEIIKAVQKTTGELEGILEE